jgi:hypothetical protein
MERSMNIDNSVKNSAFEQEANLLVIIAAEIDTFLVKALKNEELFPKNALTVSGVTTADNLSRAICAAYETVLNRLNSKNVTQIDDWKKSPKMYLPLLGKNRYTYISNRLNGVAEALASGSVSAKVIAPENVAKHDPINSPVTPLNSDADGYVGMTYDQLAAWITPDPDFIRRVVSSGGTTLFTQPSFEEVNNVRNHYFGVVAGCAEASRHLEFGLFSLMAADIQQGTPEAWKTTIIKQETRAWPPMATNAVGVMSELKAGTKSIKTDQNLFLYFSRLIRLWAKNGYDVSLDKNTAVNLEPALKDLVKKYLTALLCGELRLFPGLNKPTKIPNVKDPVQPPEWVSAKEYAKKIDDAFKEYNTN